MEVQIEEVEFGHSDDEQIERSRFGNDQSLYKIYIFAQMAYRRHKLKQMS